MGTYILKRILWFIPTLFAITVLGFLITVSAPGDPVDTLLKSGIAQPGMETSGSVTERERNQLRHKLGLDLPVFYFQITTAAEPDTLYRISDKAERNALKRLCRKFGNWAMISEYYLNLKAWYSAHQTIQTDTGLRIETDKIFEAVSQSKYSVLSLPSEYRMDVIQYRLNELEILYATYTVFASLQKYLEKAKNLTIQIQSDKNYWRTKFPSVNFYGNNQYHRWLFGDGNFYSGAETVYSKGLLRGDFGLSYTYMEPVSEVIRRRIGWSLFFTLFSIFMGYLVSIPLGLHAAEKKDGWFDRISSVGLFMLYSIPSFFLATILQLYFANVDYFNWFETTGVRPVRGFPESAGFFERVRLSIRFLVLPLICYTYSTFAFLSRTMRTSSLEILNLDFIRTAKAKGTGKLRVLYVHVLRNALLPIITVFANVFPLAMGGSVILEYIFNIPGIGRETYMAINLKDYPMIAAVFTLTGMLTLLGFLISDILYAIADPRISYTRK